MLGNSLLLALCAVAAPQTTEPLHGRVVSPAGAPVEGATVQVTSETFDHIETVRSDALGRFSTEVDHGELHEGSLWISAPTFGQVGGRLSTSELPQGDLGDIVLEHECVVQAVVLSPEGRVLVDDWVVRVLVREGAEQKNERTLGRGLIAQGRRTNVRPVDPATGGARIDQLGTGLAHVHAEHPVLGVTDLVTVELNEAGSVN